jgi:hypothetical protein
VRITRLALLLLALAVPALAYHTVPSGDAASASQPAADPWSDPFAGTTDPYTDDPRAQELIGGPYVPDAEPTLPEPDTAFARLIELLSEPGGYFDSDNLISNESSYLHVIGKLERMGVRGGAYIGVGPDQNFSYMAQVRPSIAFMVDIRRDNLLHHLLLKALFAQARNRLEYLCLLFGKPVPRDLQAWSRRSIDQIVLYVDRTPADAALFERIARDITARVKNFGYPLSDADLSTIRRFHTAFYDDGLGLKFTSYGRSARYYYPTYRQLLLETDLDGNRASFLADENDFQFLKSLHADDRIVPVVGDLAGNHALAAIADYLRQHNEKVSAFYTSNVEFYLMANGTFDGYARNVARLPHDAKSVIIRSYFGRGYPHPQSVPGYYSTQLLQTMETFVRDEAAGGYRSYSDLVLRNTLDLRS